MLTHDAWEVQSGADWEFDGELHDDDNALLDTTDASVDWVLYDRDGNLVTTLAQITLPAPNSSGKVKVFVSDVVSKDIPPGRYTDALRITIQDISTPMWSGPVLVGANYFAEVV